MAPWQEGGGGGEPAGGVVDQKKLGEGTYGEVFAVAAPDGRIHACKRFKIGERAKQEGLPVAVYRDVGIAQMLASLKHENIAVARHVVLERSDLVRISMYSDCAQSDLSQRIHQMKKSQTRFTICEVKGIVRQCLKGAAFLHGRWIIHRDLSPSNILLFPNHQVKITDFGLARSIWDPPRSLSSDGAVVKLWYRAPELLLGTRHYGPPIDVWSIGCMLAELLLLQPLFKGKDAKYGVQVGQIREIVSVLGRPGPGVWPEASALPEYSVFEEQRLMPDSKRSLDALLVDDAFPGEAGVKLAKTLLTYKPEKRLTALTAVKHEFLTTEA